MQGFHKELQTNNIRKISETGGTLRRVSVDNERKIDANSFENQLFILTTILLK